MQGFWLELRLNYFKVFLKKKILKMQFLSTRIISNYKLSSFNNYTKIQYFFFIIQTQIFKWIWN